MGDYNVVSFSGGKDSTAMLLRMIEIGMPVDEIVFCDTGAEFPQMYDHLEKVERYIGRKITRLKAAHDYEYMLLHYEIHKRDGSTRIGYSFPDMRIRWCTSYFKRDVIRRHLADKNYTLYVGIASDESGRARDAEKRYPLIEWGWAEKDALNYCLSKGFDWCGLYDIFKRVSCWCCPLKSLDEMRQLRKHFPDLWAKLLEWQKQTFRTFKPHWSVQALDERFAREDEWEKMQMSLF